MNKQEIMDTIKELAQGQGFYGRLLNTINELPKEEREAFLTKLENENFEDSVDLVLFFECE